MKPIVVPGRGSPEAAGPPSPERARSRLRRVGEVCLWSLVVGVAVVAVAHVAWRLRLVVLPVLLAIALSTFLTPAVRWLETRGWPSAAAAITVLLAALVVLGGSLALLVPVAVDEFSTLDVSLTGSIDTAQAWVRNTLPFTTPELSDAIDRLQQQLSSSLDALVRPLVGGALIALEIVTGLLLAVVVLFFLLKDGERIWSWVVNLVTPAYREDARQIGEAAWHAVTGFVRGQTLVALFDAVLIGSAIAIIGVPLALPLAVLTFFGAYVPVVGATITGMLAVLVALTFEGVVAAGAVLAAILVVQQIEGNVFQPVVVGRAVDVHPLAILLGITAGGVLAGIVGAMMAAPAVAVCGAVLGYLREGSDRLQR